ncbi:MAG: hypothetical protein IKB02_06005 [Clostridia bacterium]|nr:hypothetical protein [Clostridia bacterium]
MGFGLLFLGYFMAHLMSVFSLGCLVRLAGFMLMIYAFTRLHKYNVSFRFPFYSAFAMLGVTLADCYGKIGELLYDNLIVDSFSLPEGFFETVASADDVFSFLFHACLLYAILSIAKETEVEKIRVAAVRNFVFICLYAVLIIVSKLPFSFVESYKRYFSMPVILFYFAIIILNLVLIFTCYANICDESDIDMPLKKSRFEFINKFREETARREQKAADDSVEYAKKKLEERREKRRRK